jgi:serralysin
MSNNVVDALIGDRYFNNKGITGKSFPEIMTLAVEEFVPSLNRTVSRVVKSIISPTALETLFEEGLDDPSPLSIRSTSIGKAFEQQVFSNDFLFSLATEKDSLTSSQVVNSQSFQGEAFTSGGVIPQAATGYYFIDALLPPGAPHWSNSTVTYSFMTAVPSYYAWNAIERNNFVPMNSTQRDGVRRALQLWSEVSGLRFVEVSDAGAGGIIRLGTANTGVGSAHAYLPQNHPIGGDVWLNNSFSPNFTQTNGSFGFHTLIHEIGHALGLKHPGNYNAGGGGSPPPYLPSGEDNNQFTVMSYNRHPGVIPGISEGNPQTPMLYDLAAIQYLYGANYNTRTGNNTYAWNSGNVFVQTIWDAGGIDTISAANQILNARINLNPGTFSSIGPYASGSSYRAINNLAIAFGVAIENAIGGAGHDTLIGNALANYLSGGSGSDYLYGESGNDYLSGGSGNDYFNGGAGNDAMYGGSGSDTLLGSSGNDRLVGYASGTEYDILTGGTGTDVFVLGQSSGAFYQGNGYATITDFNWVYDYFQVKGVASQYSLQFANWIGGASQDTAIYYGNDAIGLVQDTTNVNFARDFIFV